MNRIHSTYSSSSSSASFTLVELLIVTLRRIKLWKGTVGVSERKVPTKSEPRSFFPSTSLSSSASFTLVELLIVIGILAILTSAIVLILNPAELLRQSRDTTRMSDLASIHTALSLYLTQSTQPSLGTASTIYISLPDTSPTCINLSLPTLPSGYTYACVSQASSSLMNGSGWLPINLASSSISSLPKLPLDPTNTTSSGLYYTYSTNGTQYELTTQTESTKGSTPAITDGGTLPGVYEVGTNLTLTPETRDRGLVGYWSFDEGSGSIAKDYSGYNNHGTLTNGPTWQSGTSCKKGGCLSFDGINDYVIANNVTMDQNMTWLLWVKGTEARGEHILDQRFSDVGIQQVYTYANGVIQFYDSSTFQIESNVGTFLFNDWHFIAIVGSTTKKQIFYDGILVKEVSSGMTDFSNRALYIGTRHSLANWFIGLMDDVRIYNRALSDAEIKALYNAVK